MTRVKLESEQQKCIASGAYAPATSKNSPHDAGLRTPIFSGGVCHIQDDGISLPPASVGAFLDNAAYPFWTRNIVDNFTGKILVRKGDLREAELFRTKTSHGELINICPCFKLSHPILNKDDMFVFDGRVFSVVYSNEAMCLNSVGVSCYSTGFFEPPDNNSLSDAIRAEEEFWKSSEAYETLTKWAIAYQV